MILNKIKIVPLGGLGEIGKNITAIEYNNEIVIIDCGMAFPDEDLYGVDLIIPDVAYLKDNIEKIKGFFLTHGHEDHIGSLPYILNEINVPVYGTALTIGIVKRKFEDHNDNNIVKLEIVHPGDIIELQNMKIEFIRSNHSIADSCFIAIKTPLGIILHTGDFKIDYTPIDNKVIDLERISTLGREGVLLLMADSTNVERKGHTISERKIGATLNRIISNSKGRVIVATFASNIHRIQQIIDSSVLHKRKIAFSGRSMVSITDVAIQLGYLKTEFGTIISIDEVKNYPNDEITIITTGSQGEAMAALARIAFSSHKKISIEPNDLFIISAAPIPGNDKLISKVINELFKKGAEVIYEDLEEVHVSGHAYQEELKLIHTIVKPKYFVPIHGEYRHLKHHCDLAQSLGMSKKNMFILENGDVLEISNTTCNIVSKVKSGVIYVDGLGIGDVGTMVLRDRKNLAQDGMLTIVVALDRNTKHIIGGPDIITRGFVYVKQSEELLSSIKNVASLELQKSLDNKISEWYLLKINIKKGVEKLIYEKTKRRPTIIPIIMEV